MTSCSKKKTLIQQIQKVLSKEAYSGSDRNYDDRGRLVKQKLRRYTMLQYYYTLKS